MSDNFLPSIIIIIIIIIIIMLLDLLAMFRQRTINNVLGRFWCNSEYWVIWLYIV